MEFKIGDRVVTTRVIDRYPHFLIDPPVRGTVVEPPEKGGFAVRLDVVREELNDWHNEIQWYAGDDWEADIKPLGGRQQMSDQLGFCEVCTRVRWLARTRRIDNLGNPIGICRSCAREEETVPFGTLHPDGTVTDEREIRVSEIRACPHLIMVPEHYRSDGSCRCDDPLHHEMQEWEYTWDVDRKEWV